MNEAVERPASAARLVYRPTSQWNSYWDFPGKFVLQSTPSSRLVRLQELVKSNCVEIVRLPLTSIPVKEVKLRNFGLDTKVVCLTRKGFGIWSDFFSPDWNLYWRVEEEEFDEFGNTILFKLLASSNNVISSLRDWYAPLHYIPSSSVKISQECEVLYAEAIGVFKTLEFSGLISGEICAGIDRPRESMEEEHTHAARQLLRFSSRWVCEWDSPNDRYSCGVRED